ncbi:MAG: zinc-dependent metalloprotease [Rikenellaceae bacterium]|nr:zinc-dependent metalloprotease [Rikenellaceae bacterium]
MPADEQAYRRGEPVEPEQPIVFYIDPLFPEEWKPSLKEGILRWNAAFEQIGFRNTVQVRDFPTPEENPDFDPDNMKYSCVRYVPNTVPNAMGPSWVDPRTGEILNASILIYNNVTQRINYWRFVQTAQIDPRVRAKVLPDEVRNESLAYVIAHEMGHCLGLMHNMAASASIPVDSLRSATFTQTYGTTTSIMDYARFNYVAQPEDRGVRLDPPNLGVYDYYAIDWLYRYFPDTGSAEEEALILEQLADSKAGDPVYRYGKQQMSSRYDPSAIEEDLGDDPVQAGDYGIRNLKYILSHLEEWIDDDSDFTHRAALYEAVVEQYQRYIHNVLYCVGGIYLNEAKDGTPVRRFAPVPREKQRQALGWVIAQLQEYQWLDNDRLLRRMPLNAKMSPQVVSAAVASLTNIYQNVTLSAYLAPTDPYTPAEFFEDIYRHVWSKTRAGKPLTESDKIILNGFIRFAGQSVAQIGGHKLGWADPGMLSFETAYAPSVDHIILYGLDESGTIERERGFFEQHEAQQGRGSVAGWLYRRDFGYDYAWQPVVRADNIDESATHYYQFLIRSQQLLEKQIGRAPAQDRSYYQATLFSIGKILGN